MKKSYIIFFRTEGSYGHVWSEFKITSNGFPRKSVIIQETIKMLKENSINASEDEIQITGISEISEEDWNNFRK